ncbi:MAG: hypothetical protein GC134_07115 [Proteobacteria bacterium]|nr:hypothetical protein [Pseudomonadota bacterium]
MYRILLAILCFCAAFLAAPVSHAVAFTAHEVVTTSSEKVMDALHSQKQADTDPEHFSPLLLSLLEPVVDFDAITDAVIGKYKNDLTPEQRQRFGGIFKSTMARLYAKALLKFEISKIHVLPQEEGKPFKGIVNMEVTAKDGNTYKITYTMRQSTDGQWRVRNVLLDGINLGLTYRNQFDSAMNRYNDDVEKVISTWATDMNGDTQTADKKAN